MENFKKQNLSNLKNLADLKKIFTKADFILIVFLILFSGIFLMMIKNHNSEKIVEIYHHNILLRSESLIQDKLIEIEGGITIEIKNQKIRMKESNCKKQVCVQQGWNDTFPIICVPNELSIVIKQRKEDILITR